MPDHTNHSERAPILVATLGGQPQVVTFTLDLLLQEGHPISDVIVIHPAASQPRLQHSLQCLNNEFASDYYAAASRVIHFHSHTLQFHGNPIDDIVNDDYADGTLNTIHQLICDLKQQGHQIHLSVSGGRRLMALLATSVAALNFDRHDHIWHIYTPEHIQQQAKDGHLMHVPGNSGIKLIKSPFIALGAYIANPTQPFQQAQAEHRAQMDAQERARCRQVEEQATPRELATLRAFASGLNPQEVAQKLGISPKTVDAYKTKLLDLCREVWAIETDRHIGYHFLYRTFASYFDHPEYTSAADQETSEKTPR